MLIARRVGECRSGLVSTGHCNAVSSAWDGVIQPRVCTAGPRVLWSITVNVHSYRPWHFRKVLT
jgi:hypothetical protein